MFVEDDLQCTEDEPAYEQEHQQAGDEKQVEMSLNIIEVKNFGESNLQGGNFSTKLKDHDPSLWSLLRQYEDSFFGPLLPPKSTPKLVKMDLELKEQFTNSCVHSKPYPANELDCQETGRQVSECEAAGIVEQYTCTEYPKHCSPAFLVDKAGGARRMAVAYQRTNAMTKNHRGSIPLIENTFERMAKCPFKSKLDCRSGFWQVELTKGA